MHPLLMFLVGALVLLVVIYVIKLVLDYLELDPPIRKIAMLIVALIALIILIGLLLNVFGVDFGIGQRPVVIAR